ncbi:CheR family methyltransferase [Dongia deserti]|uniref:CheR family methyltransferase n=1 Tax=Dongia deserti TaxID=2268030 RepID=UPI000E65D1D6|nr:CheR family methyltransferase [Dongia deserti]
MPETAIASYLDPWSELLARQLGLHFPVERWPELERKTEVIASALGLRDAESCALGLLSRPLTSAHIDVLAAHLTVGETYFFRDWRSFEVLEQEVLPRLIEKRAQTNRVLRFWSAGCCTGEEPYSIAILLDRLIPDLESWSITIHATDVNVQFLRRAARGIYGEWSFRDTPNWLRERYFKRIAPGRWEIHPRLKKRVTFATLNLASDLYPSSTTHTEAMDLIVCRNVLMYFRPDAARAVVNRLHQAAVLDGWLVVSPAEATVSLFAPFEPVQFSGAILGRKTDVLWQEVEDRRRRKASQPMAASFMGHGSALLEDTLVQPAASPIDRMPMSMAPAEPDLTGPEPPAQVAGDSHRAARACADLGQLAEGAEWCRKAIQLERNNPAHYYLLATIRQEMGDLDGAIQSLNSVLYLDPDHVLAHVAVGKLRLTQGRHQDAARLLDGARTLLRQLPPETILPDSGGLSARGLDEIIASIRSRLIGRGIGGDKV